MKRILISLTAVLLVFVLCSCGGSGVSSELSDIEISEELLYDEAVMQLYDYFGTHDKNSGRAYNFSIIDAVTIDGAKYFHGRLSVLETGDDGGVVQSSLKTEFFLSFDYSRYYEGTYNYITKEGTLTSQAVDIRK